MTRVRMVRGFVWLAAALCGAATPVWGQNCTVPADCDDGDACTIDNCVGTLCSYSPFCTDGDACTVDVCIDFGGATPTCILNTQPVTCPDNGDDCTDLVCNPFGAEGNCDTVVNLDGNPCDDSNPCTENDTCGGGSCSAGTPVVCPDNADDCTDLACSPVGADGNCDDTIVVNEGGVCDDGDPCNINEACALGACQGGQPVICPDNGDFCTAAVCDALGTEGNCDAVIAVNEAVLCDDGDLCTSGESCISGSCAGGSSVVCQPGDICNPADGICVDCLVDADCDDGNACTGLELCIGNVCQDGIDVVCGPGDICNPLTGDCLECLSDFDCDQSGQGACGGGEFCNLSGMCEPLPPVICPPGQTCDPADGECKECAVDADCSDGIACTSDLCLPDSTCLSVPLPGLCTDGVFCNGIEVCDLQFGCVPESAPCDDGIFCTVDDCNNDQEICIHAPVDQLCDDGDDLNGLETCNPNFGCVPGDPLDLIRVLPVIRQAPSMIETIPAGPPVSDPEVLTNQPFYIELWAQQLVDSNDPPMSGLCCVFVDMIFDAFNISCDDVDSSSSFNALDSGSCSGTGVNDLGACTVTVELGVAPAWVLVSRVTVSATEPLFGATVSTAPANIVGSICQFGAVGPDQFQFDTSAQFNIGSACLYDVDGDDFVGPGDFSFIPPCWLRTDLEPQWNLFSCDQVDFNCDGVVDPGDFSFFVTGWLKDCDDPTILFPAIPCGPSPQFLPPADKKLLNYFGLPHPDEDSDIRTEKFPRDRETPRKLDGGKRPRAPRTRKSAFRHDGP